MQHPFSPDLKVAASTALIQRGCVQVIGLGGLKIEIGERWEKLKQSIWAHLETLLRQKLGSTDFYVQLDDTSFLVTMPSASEEESQIFCLRIAHELHDSLLGRCDSGKLEIARADKVEGGVLHTIPVEGDQLRLLAIHARLETTSDENMAFLQGNHGTAKMTPKAKFRHKFVPLWDVHKEAITTYRCISPLEQAATESVGTTARARYDVAMTVSRIRHAAGILTTHLASGDRFLISLPVSYDILSSPIGRMEITTVCRSLSSELRPYLIFEISDLPYGVPQSRLSELAGLLRPFCRGVATQLPAGTPNYGAYLGAGLHAIGLSLAGTVTGGSEMNSEIFKLFAAARRQGIRCFVLDVPNEDLLHTAHAQGVNLLSSPLIGPALDMPAPIRRLLACDLLKPSTAAHHIIAA